MEHRTRKGILRRYLVPDKDAFKASDSGVAPHLRNCDSTPVSGIRPATQGGGDATRRFHEKKPENRFRYFLLVHLQIHTVFVHLFISKVFSTVFTVLDPLCLSFPGFISDRLHLHKFLSLSLIQLPFST